PVGPRPQAPTAPLPPAGRRASDPVGAGVKPRPPRAGGPRRRSVRIVSRAYASPCLHSRGPSRGPLRHAEPRGPSTTHAAPSCTAASSRPGESIARGTPALHPTHHARLGPARASLASPLLWCYLSSHSVGECLS